MSSFHFLPRNFQNSYLEICPIPTWEMANSSDLFFDSSEVSFDSSEVFFIS